VRVLDSIVNISFGMYLVLWLLYLVLSCEGFVMCGCFDNCVGVLVIVYLYLMCFVLSVPCFCIVWFVHIYSYLFCLYWCKDYCH